MSIRDPGRKYRTMAPRLRSRKPKERIELMEDAGVLVSNNRQTQIQTAAKFPPARNITLASTSSLSPDAQVSRQIPLQF
jgi:hypothetical protein